MSYETLDRIADAYIPLLALAFFASLVYRLLRYWPAVGRPALDLLYCAFLLLASYGLMFLDQAAGLWPYFGADFSTHTAVALAFTFALSRQWQRRAFRTTLGSMFTAYAALMMYQGYHTMLDIVSTALVISAAAVTAPRVCPLRVSAVIRTKKIAGGPAASGKTNVDTD